MGYKCTPQIKGLVRGEPKKGAKHRANGKAILEELGSERYSRSETLDRSRSVNNVYTGFRSGGRCWDVMQKAANDYRITGTTAKGKEFSRSLRSDAVIGWAVIINPPDEMCKGWTNAQYQKFYADSFAILTEVRPELFRRENITMTAVHRDEGLRGPDGKYGEHMHIVGNSIDEKGRYCGTMIDPKLMIDINKVYPAKMREKGWPLDDLDITDFHRMGEDPEYKERRKREIAGRKAGRSVNRYAADKAKEVDETIAQAADVLQEARAAQEEIERQREALDRQKRLLEAQEERYKKALEEIPDRIAKGITDASRAIFAYVKQNFGKSAQRQAMQYAGSQAAKQAMQVKDDFEKRQVEKTDDFSL